MLTVSKSEFKNKETRRDWICYSRGFQLFSRETCYIMHKTEWRILCLAYNNKYTIVMHLYTCINNNYWCKESYVCTLHLKSEFMRLILSFYWSSSNNIVFLFIFLDPELLKTHVAVKNFWFLYTMNFPNQTHSKVANLYKFFMKGYICRNLYKEPHLAPPLHLTIT